MIEASALQGHHWPHEPQSWLRRFSTANEVIIVTNRQPYAHERTANGAIAARHSASGVVTAVEPLARACAAVWIAHGSGSADRETSRTRDGLLVPPHEPKYRLRRIWLDREEVRGYYDGFANEGLWPMCHHRAGVPPVFRQSDFALYTRVNARFGDAVAQEAVEVAPVVLVQDYHLALAPVTIRRALPFSTIVSFWHIPWPPPQVLARCPWDGLLLRGLLQSDIVGFQTPADCAAFMDAAEDLLQIPVDRSAHTVTEGGRRVLIRAYPASIEWPNRWATSAPSVETCRSLVRAQLNLRPDVRLAVGVDRLDYSKGLEHKFLAIERLLERYPVFRDRFTLVQLAQPTRTSVPAYEELRRHVVQTATRINERFGAATSRPIELLEGHHGPETVFRFLRAAEVGYVGSLHDGMNLVAKEFVCARDDEQGVLVLSAGTGAAHEFVDAVLVDPFDTIASSTALAAALNMSPHEQRARMRRLRTVVMCADAAHWGAQMLRDAALLREPLHRRGALRLRAVRATGSTPAHPHWSRRAP